MRRIRVLSVFGTRPEAVKMAPLVIELGRRPEFESLICVTAQHREMLDSVMNFFGIKADYDLDLMERKQSVTDITTRVLTGLGAILRKCAPDIALVHGDTTTAFASSLAAFYEKIPVGHVEAGLRTHDKYSPFPEEMNRALIGRLADLHFAPTVHNAENLRKEGIRDGIFITGNTVIDALGYTVNAGSGINPALKSINLQTRRIIVMTCHRRENYGEPMENIFETVRRIAEKFEDVEIVYPVHPSPAVREAAERALGRVSRVHLIEPLEAFEMHDLISRAYMVMTDSGGLQEEAPALGKPVIVLRRETERPEAVKAGTVLVAGVDKNTIFAAASDLLTNTERYNAMAKAVNPYGDGFACRRITDSILWSLGRRGERPEDFRPGGLA